MVVGASEGGFIASNLALWHPDRVQRLILLGPMGYSGAIGAIARLRDFDVPPFAINSALLAIIAQRLVRQNCPDCARQDHVDELGLATAGGGPVHAGCARSAQLQPLTPRLHRQNGPLSIVHAGVNGS